MNRLVKVISTSLNSVGNRLIKLSKLGKYDTQDVKGYSPFGFDSNPPAGTYAIYAETGNTGKPVVIGYLNKDQLADIGESRMFSVDENGTLKFYVWAKKDGTLELGGDSKHLARFEELKSGFDQLKSDLNDMKSKWNAFTSAYVPGSPSTTGLPASLAGQNSQASTASIDNSKIEQIKTL